MGDVRTTLEALNDGDPGRRDLAAEALGDFLRGAAQDRDTVRLVIGELVGLAVTEPETRVRESALNAVAEAFERHRLPLGLVEPLVSVVRTLEPALMGYVLYIFGSTQDPRARPLIEPFLHHPHSAVREEARIAITEIVASETAGNRSSGPASP